MSEVTKIKLGNKLETPVKWMEASRFSSSKESAPYTMCSEGDVQCCVWHWWGNSTPRCTSKTQVNPAYYCTFLQPHLRLEFTKKRQHLGVHNPIILHDNARSRTATAVKVLLRRWQWEILEHPPYSLDLNPCDYDLFTKVKDPLRGTP